MAISETDSPLAPPQESDVITSQEWMGDIEQDQRTWRDRYGEIFSFRSSGAVYALLVVVGWFLIRSAWIGKPFYLSEVNVSNVLEQASLIGIMSVGMTVLLISGNFDLSVAANAAMGAMVMALTMDRLGPLVAVLLGLLVTTVGGLFNGLVHYFAGINSFIITLGTMFAFRGIVLYLNDGAETILTREDDSTIKRWAGEEFPPVHVLHLVAVVALVAMAVSVFRRSRRSAITAGAVAAVSVIVSLVWTFRLTLAYSVAYLAIVAFVAWFVLRFTVTGRRLYAVGGNMEAARAAGVNLSRYVIGPFIVVGFCAGVASVVVLAKIGSVPPSVLETRELDVIASSIIGGVALTGGTGSVIKTLIGALLLFVLRNGFNYTGTSPFLTEIFIGALVIMSAAAYVVAEKRATTAGRV